MQAKKQEMRKALMDEMTTIRKSKKEGQSLTETDDFFCTFAVEKVMSFKLGIRTTKRIMYNL